MHTVWQRLLDGFRGDRVDFRGDLVKARLEGRLLTTAWKLHAQATVVEEIPKPVIGPCANLRPKGTDVRISLELRKRPHGSGALADMSTEGSH